MDTLVKDRNAKWVEHLVGMLKTHNIYFVVVGFGHLVGQFGLPTALKLKGYMVEQL